MFRRSFLKSIGIAGAGTAIPIQNLYAVQQVSGTISGKVLSNGAGVANVKVSDGFSIVSTDKNGQYQFACHSKSEFVFITIPSGYEINHESGIARFYHHLQADKATQSYNFNLQKNKMDDDKHTLIVWADTQMIKDQDAVSLINTSSPDTAVHAKLYADRPVHGICVGDLVHDRFDLFDEYSKAVAGTSIPFFQIIGNHDMDYTARSDDGSQSKFKSLFGPTYFSFNRGKIHYVMLDDVFFIGKNHAYIGYLTGDTLQWLEKDLQFVEPGSTVIVSLHIPTNTHIKDRTKATEESIGGVVSNREHLYSLLKPYKVHFMSGHTHFNENWEQDNMFEHNHGTVCGAWWRAQNVATDGTPNGYGVYEIEGSTVKWHYKSVGFPKEYQLKIYPLGKSVDKPNSIVANVWNFDQKWTVEWFEDGASKGKMEQFTGFDPVVSEFYEKGSQTLTDHLFAAVPSPGVKEISVKVTDRFGNVYQEKMNL